MEKIPVIVYLGPDYFGDLEFETTEERDELVLTHPNREEYKLEDFELAFNEECISDLGVIVVMYKQSEES